MKYFASLLVLLLLLPLKAHAYCFEEAGRMYNISPLLLWSIGKGESKFNPRAINRNANGTYDFGVMQINSSWKKVLGEASWNSLADPCHNVKVGAWILAQCVRKHGYNWKAVGCYNSTNPTHQKNYSSRIARIISDTAYYSQNDCNITYGGKRRKYAQQR